MGKRSFICISSWGVSSVTMYILLFLAFGFLWYCVYVFIYGSTVSLPKHFFRMVSVLWLVIHLKFTFADNFAIHVTLCRLICLFMLIFFLHFCLGISEEDDLLVKYLSCRMCLFLRNTEKHDMCGVKSDIV